MRAVDIQAARADRALRQRLERALRRALNGLRSPHRIAHVLLITRNYAEASRREQALKRATAAWREECLTLVCVDGLDPPMGFRDLDRVRWSLDAADGDDAVGEAVALSVAKTWLRNPKRPRPAPPVVGAAELPPAPSMRQRLFVSYARKDSARVEPLAAHLLDAGFDLWMDRADLTGGARWPAEIVRAIKEASGVLLFCSAHAFASDHVFREVNLAGSFSKRLLPIYLEPVEAPDEFLYYLSVHQSVDAAAPDAAARAGGRRAWIQARAVRLAASRACRHCAAAGITGMCAHER